MANDWSASILLIDGNHREREYYAHRLRMSSPEYEIFQALDGQSGLQYCQERLFDCVILELNLPDMSGFEVLLKLVPRPRCPEIPVVVLTQLANEALLKAALVNGAHACLQKNFTSGDLLEEAILKAMATVGTLRKEQGDFNQSLM